MDYFCESCKTIPYKKLEVLDLGPFQFCKKHYDEKVLLIANSLDNVDIDITTKKRVSKNSLKEREKNFKRFEKSMRVAVRKMKKLGW